VSIEILQETVEAMAELERRREDQALVYWPTIYPSQKDACQSSHQITALFGANQAGKSVTGLRRMAWDLTGIYPEWYEGPRTLTAINAWIVGETSDLTRDGLQKKLLGPDLYNPGKGGILSRRYLKSKPVYKQNGGGAIDYFLVPHVSGGTSACAFKNYAQGRVGLQSATIQRLLIDEEPPWEEWQELMMRISEAAEKGDGYTTICFTPLKGKTKVVKTLWEDNPDVGVFLLSAEEATHLGPGHIEKWKRLLKNDPAALKARLYGLPDVNTGLVWNANWSEFRIPRFEIPPAWPRLGAIDYGWTHPTCLVILAKDPRTDDVFVERAWRFTETKYWQIVKIMRPWWEKGIQFFGDPSAEQPDRANGEKLLHTYLNDLHPGWESVPPEERAIVNAPRTPQIRNDMVQKRLDEGTLWFFDDLDPVLFEEVQGYAYTKKGKLPEVNDDYPDTLGYGIQMLSRARPPSAFRRPVVVKTFHLKTCMKGF
jgi:phage terminase large subunit-like protein